MQIALLHDAALRAAARARRRGACCTSTRSTRYGFSWWRRTTHENVDLNRNFHDFCQAAAAPTRPTTSSPRCSCRDTGRRRPRSTASIGALRRGSTACAALQAAISGGQHDHPEGLFYGGRNPTWSHLTLRHVLRDHATRCARLGWIDLHTGLGPERRTASASSPAATTPRRCARARAWWGDDVTSIYDGSSSSAPLHRADVARRLRGMPAGRVHRHRARIRHHADARA